VVGTQEEEERSTASEVLAKYAAIWAEQPPVANSIFTTSHIPTVLEPVSSKSQRPSSLAEGRVDLKRICSLSEPKTPLEMLPSKKTGKLSQEKMCMNPEED